MPKSKKRPRATAAVRPARGPTLATTPEKALTTATLALLEASLQIVQEAELHITAAARAGRDPAHQLDVHHHLRTAALGLLVAYSKLEDLPDPRESAPTA